MSGLESHARRRGRMWRVAALVVTLGATAPATAQDVVGTTTLNGKQVELLDNMTWRFSSGAVAATDDCAELKIGVSFCGTAPEWQRVTNVPAQISAAYRHSDTEYAQFVIEALGSDAGLEYEGMREIVLGYAAQAAATDVTLVPVLAEEDVVVEGVAGKTLVYAVKVQGLNFVFANTIIIEKNRVMQAMTYKLGTAFTDDNRGLHDRFLALIDLGAGN